MKRKYTTVVFDLDGVIIDSEIMYYTWLKQFLSDRGMVVDESRLITINGLSINESEILLNDLCSPYTDENMWEVFLEEFIDTNVDYRALYVPGVRELLSFLKENDIKIGLASSSQMEKIVYVLNDLEIDSYFSAVFSGHDLKESKPNPEIYLKSFDALGSVPGESIVIEDSNYGIEAGKRAGAYVIAVKDDRLGYDQSMADYQAVNMQDIKEHIENLIL